MFTDETRVYATFIAGVIVLSIFISRFVFTMLRQHRLKGELERKLMRAEAEMFEKDRMRIARDLHDELASLLSAVRFQLIAHQSSGKKELICNAIDNLDRMLRTVRHITNELAPVNLHRKGLEQMIRDLSAAVNAAGVMNINFDFREMPMLTEQMQTHLFRILSEIVHNMIRHAKASDGLVRVFVKKQRLIIIAEDNGIGFDYEEKAVEGTGLGLQNISGRVSLLGGELSVESEKNKGCLYRIEIPIAWNTNSR